MPTIIIPVYNAFDEAIRCLKSIALHSPGEKVVVVDDASPDGVFEYYCSLHNLSLEHLSFDRNEENLGYGGSCNRGIVLAGDDDVVLLNSDTIVTAGWIEKLKRAAYSRKRVGTVTPFTNNGAICSLPHFGIDNNLPSDLSVDEFAALVEEVADGTYPELPTCVGFCVYICREALKACGMFKAEAFPRGYGEENDVSLRFAQAGYSNLLDPSTFIYHGGSASFQEEKSELMEQGQKIVEHGYPHYADDIARFYVQNPLRPYQSRVHEALLSHWLSTKEGVVLHLLHNGPYVSRIDPLGGTERCVQGLIEDLPQLAHWSLVVSQKYYILSAHMGAFHREFYFPLATTSLADIVSEDLFPLVHVHHTRWFNQGEVAEVLADHSNVVLSVHDFVLGCPRFHLLTPEVKHCDTTTCSSICGYSKSFISRYRESGQHLLSLASKVVCYSDSSRELLSNIFLLPESLEVVSHGISVPRVSEVPVQRSAEDPLRVALFGHIVPHKGGEILAKLFQRSSLPSGVPVEWHLFGPNDSPTRGEHVRAHGSYTHESLASLVRESGAHCALFLSQCPETYSLAVDEAWACGLPVIVSPLGAPKERVQKYGAGWILPTFDENDILSCLETVGSNTEEFEAKAKAVQQVPLLSRQQEALELALHYRSSARTSVMYEALLAIAKDSPLQPTTWKKVVGSVVNVCVKLLDSLRVRRKVEAVIYRVIPERILRRVKNVRRSAMISS